MKRVAFFIAILFGGICLFGGGGFIFRAYIDDATCGKTRFCGEAIPTFAHSFELAFPWLAAATASLLVAYWLRPRRTLR